MYKLDPPPSALRVQPPRPRHGDLARRRTCPTGRLSALDSRRAPRGRAAPAAGAGRARRRAALHESVGAQHVDRLQLLSARLVHDEVQPQAERAAGGAARASAPASVSGREHAAGPAGDPVRAAGDPGRDRRLARRQPAAGGRCAGRADGALGRRGLFPRPGRAAHPGLDSRQRARHQSRLGPPGRASRPSRSRATAAAWSTSTTSRPS